MNVPPSTPRSPDALAPRAGAPAPHPAAARIRRLVGASVPGGVGVNAPAPAAVRAPASAPAPSLSLHASPADRCAAATGVALGRNLDVTA
jgi:hypothetical protein